ncbi:MULTISPECIES: hypothetical protein [unclassified Moorena]|uniref:hypothetical protein n=1 Tax=unclassified Moorena TaxID=2683338 RepID=UPI001400B649|nr:MULTISPECIES: hypothetical protein [unclassified Moorena]NEO15329.1 hypothetical protein [Moorena sp. SIO3E8]NEQ01730.1 hypothetical protein [Moorena sp. SIO3F7]
MKSFVEWASCPFEILPLRAGCPLYSDSLLDSATPATLPIPDSRFPIPDSLLPTPYSLNSRKTYTQLQHKS